jgi:hypothetical protein
MPTLLLAAALLSAALTLADDDAALRTAVPPAATTIAVMVLGELDTQAAAARDAVVGALRRSGHRVRLIGGAPGTYVEMPSTDVIQRFCSLFHLDMVAVVSPGASLEVQLYDRTGTLVGHPVMAARPADPAPRSLPTPPAPQSVPAPPARIEPADPRVKALGEELYAREQVGIGLDGIVYQGQGLRRLEGADFYATVGRPDLADQYRRRQRNKGVAMGVGGAALGVGVIWGIADLLFSAAATVASPVPCLLSGGGSSHESSGGEDWCHPHQPSGLPWVTGGLGLGLLVFSAAVPSDPLPQAERRQLMDRHNADLRARAGLGSLRVAPVVTGDGGGMVLSGSF